MTPTQARFLWWLSWLTLANGLYAGCGCSQWDLSAIMVATFLTSVNYWRRPVPGWRRSLDVAAVRTNLVGHLWAGATRGAPWPYFVLTAVALSCYGIGVHVHGKGRHRWWESVAWHAGLHVLGNAGHLVLYRSVALG